MKVSKSKSVSAMTSSTQQVKKDLSSATDSMGLRIEGTLTTICVF